MSNPYRRERRAKQVGRGVAFDPELAEAFDRNARRLARLHETAGLDERGRCTCPLCAAARRLGAEIRRKP